MMIFLISLVNPSTTEEEHAASVRQRSAVEKKVYFDEARRRTSRFNMNVWNTLMLIRACNNELTSHIFT